MDVEKRMNLSLEDIIKEKGKAKPKRSAGTQNGSVKGRGKVKIANLSSQKKSSAKKGNAESQTAPKGRKGLGVQKKGLKVQRAAGRGGGKRIAIAVPVARKPGKGRQSTQKAAAAPRKGGIAAGRGGKARAAVREVGRQRTVEMPRLSDLRITIQNEKAANLRFPVTSVAYQMQSSSYAYPPTQRSSAPAAPPVVPHGFGPRNLQPRGEGGYTRLAPDYPVPRPRQDYGVSRATLGRAIAPLVAVKREPMQRDFDTDTDKSYMRMDNVR